LARTTQKALRSRKTKDVEYDLWILVSRVYHMIAKLRNMELNRYNILPVQAYILYIIQALGNETNPAELSKYVYQQRSSVSDILNRMEKQRLITKTKKTGGKGRILVKMTEKGQKTLQLSRKRDYLHSVMSALTEEKGRQLESALEIVRDKAIEELSSYQKTVLPPSQLSKYYQEKNIVDSPFEHEE
jgi:DNA-binding MarR family transcriptional regulator